jgi:hypothetical protein
MQLGCQCDVIIFKASSASFNCSQSVSLQHKRAIHHEHNKNVGPKVNSPSAQTYVDGFH